MEIIGSLIAFAGLLLILILANLAERHPLARKATPIFILGINALIVLNGFSYLVLTFFPPDMLAEMGLAPPSRAQADSILLTSLLMAAAASLPLVPQLRRRLAQTRLLPPAFNPDSTMHTVGLVYSVYLVGQAALSFALAEDIGALAEDISSIPVIGAAVLQAAIFYLVAFVGVGFLIRRGPRATLERLGLVWPAWWHVVLALVVAVGLLIAQFCVIFTWLALAPENFEEQTQAADALTDAIDSMGAASLLAFTSSTSEEIAFRGALQPVMGVGLTSIVFAVAHVQYALTPATFFILVLAVVLGILRARTNTSTTILCHFFYNFALMSLAVFAEQMLPLLETAPDLPPETLPEAAILILTFLTSGGPS